MSVFDGLKGKAGVLKDRAVVLVGENSGKLKDGIGKVGGMVDNKTGGKYSDKIVGFQAKASDMVDKADKGDRANGVPPVDRHDGTGPTGPHTPPA